MHQSNILKKLKVVCGLSQELTKITDVTAKTRGGKHSWYPKLTHLLVYRSTTCRDRPRLLVWPSAFLSYLFRCLWWELHDLQMWKLRLCFIHHESHIYLRFSSNKAQLYFSVLPFPSWGPTDTSDWRCKRPEPETPQPAPEPPSGSCEIWSSSVFLPPPANSSGL